MINVTDTHITVTPKANHQRKRNHCFTSTDSAGGGRSIFTPRGISVLWSSSTLPSVVRFAGFRTPFWFLCQSLRYFWWISGVKTVVRGKLDLHVTWRMVEEEPCKKRLPEIWSKGNEKCLNQHNLQTIIKHRKAKRQRNHWKRKVGSWNQPKCFLWYFCVLMYNIKETCEVFLCYVAIVRVRAYILCWLLCFLILRGWWVFRVLTLSMSLLDMQS